MKLKQLAKRLSTRSFDRVFLRILSISKRYGWTPERYCCQLTEMIQLCKTYGFKPTFPVTASVVERHPQRFRAAQTLGAEFAIHGLKHIDYTHLSRDDVKDHAQKAQQAFKMHGLEAQGFRYPYLRQNHQTVQCIADSGYQWDSSQAIAWTGLAESEFSSHIWSNYQSILRTYHAITYQPHQARPRWDNGFIHLPVTVPDDDILIERLELKCSNKIDAILSEMYVNFTANGDFLNLQMHPERFSCFREPLESLMSKAANDSAIWKASLNEVATWWKKRCEIAFDVQRTPEGWFLYLNTPECAVFEIWQAGERKPQKWDEKKAWKVKPLIGVAKENISEWSAVLRNEGFLFEVDASSADVAVMLPDRSVKAEACDLYALLDKTSAPTIKVSTWPQGFRAAVSVSGDIDGIDLIDFWERFHGN